MTSESERVLNFLASAPRFGTSSVTRSQLREIMLQTDGWIMAQGARWEIAQKRLGGGVYQVRLLAAEKAKDDMRRVDRAEIARLRAALEKIAHGGRTGTWDEDCEGHERIARETLGER